VLTPTSSQSPESECKSIINSIGSERLVKVIEKDNSVQIKKDDLTYQLRDSFLLRFADKPLSKQIGLLSKSELGINDPFRD